MKRAAPYIPYIIGYVMILFVNTAQLVNLYSGLVGEEGTGVSPWLSLAALDLSILLLSFRKPEWGNINPAKFLAVIVGILDLWFLGSRIEAEIFSGAWIALAIPALLFSIFFAGGIYYMSEELANIHKEQQEKGKAEQDMSKSLQEQIKTYEEQGKEIEAVVKRMGEWVRHGNGYARNVWNGEEFDYEWITSKDYEKQGERREDQEIG